MKLKKIPFILALCLGVHLFGLVLASWLINASGIKFPVWAENFYAAIFLFPELAWSKPWNIILSHLHMMEGEWLRMPSMAGFALVDAIYFFSLLGLGMYLNRKSS